MKLIDMSVGTLIKQSRKAGANPGGGAILILSSNLALNLTLMMDKNDWGDYKEKAKVSRETIINLSDELTKLMQDDVDNFDMLMLKIKSANDKKEDYILASEALIRMNEINLKALELLGFYLKNGKYYALSDGQIANDMLKEMIFASESIIEVNIGSINDELKHYQSQAQKLHAINTEIIERRKQ